MSNDTEVIEQKKTTSRQPRPPRKYNVLILNDDKTPVEFVIAMLMSVFKHNQDRAMALTLEVHNKGSGIAGTYTHEIAEQKVMDGTNLARQHGFPLVLKAEEQ